MRDDSARLVDIYLACRDVMEFVAGVDHEAYIGDRKLQYALCRALEVIGEAARMISDDFKQDQGEVPWVQIVGLRHRIVHEYFRLDTDILWEIVQRDVPALMRQLGPLVPPETQE